MAGAGGAAAGAVEALTRAGAEVRLLARRPESRTQLRARLRRAAARAGHRGALEGRRPGARARRRDRAGLGGPRRRLGRRRRPPAGLDALAGDAAVLEMAYGGETPLAAAARARGTRYADGLGMLVHQAAHAIELALGEAPPLAPLFEAVRSAG